MKNEPLYTYRGDWR